MEPIAEGIAKVVRPFSDAEITHIIKRRKELEIEQKNDRQIGRALAKEMGRSRTSIVQKMGRLVKEGRVGKNKNMREKKYFRMVGKRGMGI
jgi:hypothetical protein